MKPINFWSCLLFDQQQAALTRKYEQQDSYITLTTTMPYADLCSYVAGVEGWPTCLVDNVTSKQRLVKDLDLFYHGLSVMHVTFNHGAPSSSIMKALSLAFQFVCRKNT